MRLPLGIGPVAEYLGPVVLLGSIAVGFARRDTAVFTIGFAVYVALKVGAFVIGALEPDTRDPVTVMQLRRYGPRESRVYHPTP